MSENICIGRKEGKKVITYLKDGLLYKLLYVSFSRTFYKLNIFNLKFSTRIKHEISQWYICTKSKAEENQVILYLYMSTLLKK